MGNGGGKYFELRASKFRHVENEGLTFGRAAAGLNTYSKGVSLGLFQRTPKEVKKLCREMHTEESVAIGLLHRAAMGKDADEGLRELSEEHPNYWRVLSKDRIVWVGRSRPGSPKEG